MEVVIVQLQIGDTRLTATGAPTVPSDNLDGSQFGIGCHAFQFRGTSRVMFTRFFGQDSVTFVALCCEIYGCHRGIATVRM